MDQDDGSRAAFLGDEREVIRLLNPNRSLGGDLIGIPVWICWDIRHMLSCGKLFHADWKTPSLLTESSHRGLQIRDIFVHLKAAKVIGQRSAECSILCSTRKSRSTVGAPWQHHQHARASRLRELLKPDALPGPSIPVQRLRPLSCNPSNRCSRQNQDCSKGASC